jgi:hypothetical protein
MIVYGRMTKPHSGLALGANLQEMPTEPKGNGGVVGGGHEWPTYYYDRPPKKCGQTKCTECRLSIDKCPYWK